MNDILIGISIGIAVTNIAWTFINRYDYKKTIDVIDRYHNIMIKMQEEITRLTNE